MENYFVYIKNALFINKIVHQFRDTIYILRSRFTISWKIFIVRPFSAVWPSSVIDMGGYTILGYEM